MARERLPQQEEGHEKTPHIVVDEISPSFVLRGDEVEYRIHVDKETGALVHDHFGSPVRGRDHRSSLGSSLYDLPREWPDTGRGGDFSLPAVLIRNADGSTISDWRYKSHRIVEGKEKDGLFPSTFGKAGSASTLLIDFVDQYAKLEATLSYSIFPAVNTVVRKTSITNKNTKDVEILRAASWSTDFNGDEWDMIQLTGDWGRECTPSRHRVHLGTQGFQVSCGVSSPHFNPFLGLVRPNTTEHDGDAWGFSLIWSGSHAAEVERFVQLRTRVLLGLNPLHTFIALKPGETFHTPECAGVYSSNGIGGMSRKLHRLFRSHLCRSSWVGRERPVLLNTWEGAYFDFTGDDIWRRANSAASYGISLLVMDDGWFGRKYPRVNDLQGLGDWMPNDQRFPGGLPRLIEKITDLDVSKEKLKFGIWVEPEMVNPRSELYEQHPDWVMHATGRPITTQRNQYILNLGRREAQDYVIAAVTSVLQLGNVSYIKWDHNRRILEFPQPSAVHAHMLGLYRILTELTNRFPDVLFEGCASGGGRFDPGIYGFFPQTWTSDDTDALERLTIQFGTSIAYPPSAMGCHVSVIPNEQIGRTTPFEFRAHVAMMGGSFGFEMDLDTASNEDKAMIRQIIDTAEKVNPYVIHGDQYRLATPDTNWPAVLYLREDGSKGVLLAFQIRPVIGQALPNVLFQGLDLKANYRIDDEVYSGAGLHRIGLPIAWSKRGDYQSRLIWISRE